MLLIFCTSAAASFASVTVPSTIVPACAAFAVAKISASAAARFVAAMPSVLTARWLANSADSSLSTSALIAAFASLCSSCKSARTWLSSGSYVGKSSAFVQSFENSSFSR